MMREPAFSAAAFSRLQYAAEVSAKWRLHTSTLCMPRSRANIAGASSRFRSGSADLASFGRV